MPSTTGPDWFSTQDAARYLGIAARTLYRLIDQGEVPAYKFGRVIRLRRHEVEAFIQSNRVSPGGLAHLSPVGKGRARDRASQTEYNADATEPVEEVEQRARRRPL